MHTEDFSISKLIEECKGLSPNEAYAFLSESLEQLEHLGRAPKSPYYSSRDNIEYLAQFIKGFLWYFYEQGKESRPISASDTDFASMKILSSVIEQNENGNTE